MSERITNHRLEAFCDGIFAIAITLLILEIKIPDISNVHSMNDLRRDFFSQWPSWFAFLLTFITLFIAWVNHHNGLRQIDKTSNIFIYANGFLMLTVVVFPFSTGMLGRFLNTEFSTLPIILYCITNFAHALAWAMVAFATIQPKDLSKNPSSLKKLKKSKRLTAIGCFYNLLITLLAFWFPAFALIMITGAWIIYLIAGLFITTIE